MTIWGCTYNRFIQPACMFSPMGYSRSLPPAPMPVGMPMYNRHSIWMGCPSFYSAPMPMPSIPPMPIAMPMPYVSAYNPYLSSLALNLSIFSGINNYITGNYNYTATPAYISNPYCLPPIAMPEVNFKKKYDEFLSVTKSSRTSSSSKVNTSNYSVSSKSDINEVNRVGYNAQKGEGLVNVALNQAESESTGWCAKYVKQAIENARLGAYKSGHAYQCVEILRNNSNFKEINISGEDLRHLPAGCIIVYDRGVAGYSSDHGHVEITTGTGCAVSDFVNGNIKTPTSGVHVFVPV